MDNIFRKFQRHSYIWQLQLASNKKLDLFIYASGGRKIIEDISKSPNVMGIDEIWNDILKNNLSGTAIKVFINWPC